jgi:GT2 family glycosyltransferase
MFFHRNRRHPVVRQLCPSKADLSKPKFTTDVVICTHNRPTELTRCLTALMSNMSFNAGVIVVDSAPVNEHARLISESFGAKWVRSPIKGLSRARNVGVMASRADVIAFLDDDIIPHNRWLCSLLNAFTGEKVMSATGPILPESLVNASFSELVREMELSAWGPEPDSLDRTSLQGTSNYSVFLRGDEPVRRGIGCH